MREEHTTATISRSVTDCAICRRSVLVGEPLTPFHDPKLGRSIPVCGLCRDAANARGWTHAGDPVRRKGSARLRVERIPTAEHGPATSLALAPEQEPERSMKGSPDQGSMLAPQAAILERAIGLSDHVVSSPTEALRMSLYEKDLELERLRQELNPARRAEEQRQVERLYAQVRDLSRRLEDRGRVIERLQRARFDETSPMRMSSHALTAFNQSKDLERMSRIARTLGDPIINVHDEGPGIPRRVRITFSWDIAWYEFVVKIDLGAGRASVHETGTGGDCMQLPLERRRGNASWSESGLKIS